MRWQRLFSDLETRFSELADAQAAAELADRERVAFGSVDVRQRLSGSIDHQVTVRLIGGASVAGALRTVGPDWLLLGEPARRECVIAMDFVAAVEGLTAATGPELHGLDLRLDLRRALRGLARDRAPVSVALAGWTGARSGSTAAGFSNELTGTIDRVGADFVEIAVHAPWEPRRAIAVRAVSLVPLRSLMLVRALPLG